jgi:hypothetical protein
LSFLPLYGLTLFNLRFLITALVSSNFSCTSRNILYIAETSHEVSKGLSQRSLKKPSFHKKRERIIKITIIIMIIRRNRANATMFVRPNEEQILEKLLTLLRYIKTPFN